MTVSTTCPSCGVPTGPDDRFCGSCGADLRALSPAASPKVAAKHTMLGVVSPLAQTGGPAAPVAAPAPAAMAPTPAAAAPAKTPAKTMLGMMSPLAAPAPAPAAGPAAAPQPAQPAKADLKKTMLGVAPGGLVPPGSGVAAVVEPGQAPGKALTASAPETAPAQKRTMFGVPEEVAGAERASAPAEQAAPPAASPKLNAAPTNRTMLGVAAPAMKPVANAALAAQSKHTMLGAAPPVLQPGPTAESATPAAGTAPIASSVRGDRARSFTPVPDQVDDEEAPPVAPKRSLVPVVVAVVLVLVAAALAAGYFLTRGPALSVRVVGTDAGEALEVEVPGSAPGTKVRFAGEERPLEAGRARFALRADSLSLGKNELSVDVIAPGGDVDTGKVQLAVDYRVRADLSPLGGQTPAIDVVVDALPGAKVTLDGAPLALDAHGHAVKRMPVTPQAGATFSMNARYRIELPEGAPVEGAVNVVLPVTTMQIDRPGPEMVTDQPLVEVAGAVEAAAEVLIDGQVIPVRDGRFLHRVRVEQPGDYKLRVVARAANKAPRVAELSVRRVADLTMAAATFKHDPSLTYARIAQNPVIYRGQNVAFDGRVYNVEVQGGRSVLQMLVLDCPGTARCPLWVEYSQATEATVDSWVRVLGTISGEQQFRSKQGQVQTVPSVQAQYVLKLAR